MKKLITGVIAAAALVFGLAGCQGDLHDVSEVDVSTLYVKGSFISWNDDTKLTRDTDGTYYYEWIATSSSGTFALDSGGWLTTYRGTASDELYEGFSTGETKATLYPHNDADCMPITMDAGATYRMVITGGPGNIECEIVKVADAIPFALFSDGENIAMSASSSTTFEYAFSKSEAGSLKFNIKSGTAIYAPANDSTLAIGTAEKSIDGTTTPSDKVWTFNYEKDVPYKVVVTYNSTSGSVDVSVEYGFLIACDILSGSQFSDDKLTWTFTSEYALAELEFTYDTSKTGWGSATPFAVHIDGWGDKYCGGATVKLGEDFVELPNNGDNANLDGLTNGTTYILSIKATTDKVYAKVAEK